MVKNLDDLLSTRFKGAVNIRGIRYQLLYSLLRGFDLYNDGNHMGQLRLEGIEDVDVRLWSSEEFVQVKTADKPWNWAALKEPIKGFLEAYRIDAASRFRLAVNFKLRHDIEKLAHRKSLAAKDKSDIEKKLINLCKQVGATITEAEALIERLEISSLSDEEVLGKLRPVIAQAFELGSQAVDVYLLALVAKFLEWAKDRKTITRADLDKVRVEVGEALSRETEYQAYGRSLITRLQWEHGDSNHSDFFEKGTRPGHIIAGLDVRRPVWLMNIERALDSSGICILRSSSGQGKSTLMYRFAYDKWPKDHTFILRSAASVQETEQVRSYLRFRTGLGLPTLLLIDDAGWNMRHWPLVAQECAALGIQVLVTARHEDWHRFAREDLTNFEILEPELSSDEAKQIFKVFQSQGRLHPSVDSADWAYERIGEPHLLLEYVYLITQGRMLEDRLREQVRQFSVQGEDASKIELLRRAALAHALGVPLTINDLMRNIDFQADPQHALRTMSEEYVTIDRSLLSGLHWVRSDHLVRILHEGYPNMAKTALVVLDAIPSAHVSGFVSNALCRDELDQPLFLDGLVKTTEQGGVGFLIAVLDGIFDAGERHFFETNKALFDEAFEEFGPSGPFFMNTSFMPTVKLSTVDELAEIMGERGNNLRKISDLSADLDTSDRGIDRCANFLRRVAPAIRADELHRNPAETGRLLDWCALTKVSLPAWADVKHDLIQSSATVFDLSLEQFCNFAQGLFRYDEVAYMNWFHENESDVIGYLKLHTDCTRIEIEEKVISIEFMLRDGGGDLGHEMAMSRIRRLRSALPFCDRYRSSGVWIIPFGIIPTWEQTKKDISKEHLPFESDAKKNALWGRTVETRYIPDSYYRFEDAWYSLRSDALEFVRSLSSAIEGRGAGKRTALTADAIEQLDHSLRFVPHISSENFVAIGKSLSEPLQKLLQFNSAPNEWASSFRNFFVQIIQYLNSRDETTSKMDDQTGRLAVFNFNDARSKLEDMHAVFKQLFREAPDYFGASYLDEDEQKAYTVLGDLLDALITNPPSVPQSNIRQYAREKRERRRDDAIRRLRRVVTGLEADGISFVFPRDIYFRHPARYIALAFSVSNIHQKEEPLLTAGRVVEVLSEILDIADFFCLIPIHDGSRFQQGGYQFSSSQIREMLQGDFSGWETFVPHDLPDGVMRCLPSLPMVPSGKLQLRAEVTTILAELEALTNWREEIEQLNLWESNFEKQLYDKYMGRLLHAERELGIAAGKVKEWLIADPTVDTETDLYTRLIEILEAIEAAAKRGDLHQLSTSNNHIHHAADIVESLITM
jgi:hypothetical protein